MSVESKLGSRELSILIFRISGTPGSVQHKLRKLPGLAQYEVDPVEDIVRVEYDPKVVSESEIKEACSTRR